MTKPTGHSFPATAPGCAFPLSQRPRTFKHGTQTEYAAYRTRFGSSTPEPPRWDDDISSISGDTGTCFGDSEDGSDRDQALEPLQLPASFWPSRGSKQNKAAIAKELQEGVIQQLPPSANTRLPDFRRMTRQDVELRIKELWGYPGKSVQVDTVLEVGCRQRSMIFVAKTGIGKSLIFETIPLLDPNHPGIALIIMPLKHIQQQQLEKVNRLPGARAVVYDGEHHSELLRYQIAAGHFTHVFIGPEMILTKDFHNDVIKSESFRGRLRIFAIDEIHCVDDWKDFRPRYSELAVLRARLPSVPYLGVTATLTPSIEDYIKKSSGFDYSCPVLRTSNFFRGLSHTPALPIFPSYNQFHPGNHRDDDDTYGLGFEVTREPVYLSEKSRSYQPTPRTPLHPAVLREITGDEFRAAVQGSTARRLDALADSGKGDGLPVQVSAAETVRDEAVGSDAGAGRSLGGARIDRMIGARVFSHPVGTIFDNDVVTATMQTALDGQRKIRYSCHAHGLDVSAGDFRWSAEALAFK